MTNIPVRNSDTGASVDEDMAEILSKRSWQLEQGYAVSSTHIKMQDAKFLMHRVVLSAKDDETVDHIDGNRLNNCRSNLRIVTATQNAQNRKLRCDSKTGFKGVAYKKERPGNRKPFYTARIQIDGRRINLGAFPTALAAAFAYDISAREHFGQFARLNFPYGIG